MGAKAGQGVMRHGAVSKRAPGSYLRHIDSCITQLKAQGPSRTCNESKEEEEDTPHPTQRTTKGFLEQPVSEQSIALGNTVALVLSRAMISWIPRGGGLTDMVAERWSESDQKSLGSPLCGVERAG